MLALHPDLDLERFFAGLRRPCGSVLFIDYDGTVAPFHRRPERAVPYPQVAEVLKRVTQRCATRVVLVTGRRFADLRGPLAWIPHTEVWAAHGWERRTEAGEHLRYEPGPEARKQLHLAAASVRHLEMHGARVEPKPASVAIHWRGLAEPARRHVQEAIADAWGGFDGDPLEALPFDGGIELRARGRTKGDAVRDALAECAPDAACAYLGDDLTDEDAFAAVKGRGLSVLVRPELRETCADLWLRPPGELIDFLEAWCAAGTAS